MTEGQISKVYLLDVPLENDYQNTLYFTSKEDQQTYFQSRVKHSFTDFSYQRKDSYIRVPLTFDDAYKINYVMYQNPKYSNKWFYAFVTDVKFENDEVSTIYIETDVIQTWLFDYNVKASFVEREHVSNDTVGRHTTPEKVEMGEYISNGHDYDTTLKADANDLRYILSVTFDLDLLDSPDLLKFPGGKYNGIFSGAKYYGLDSVGEVGIWLNQLDKEGKGDSIVGLFMAPKYLAPRETTEDGVTRWNVKESDTSINHVTAFPGENNLNGYTPKNKKLLTFPYRYLLASNNNGGAAIYHYEKWDANDGSSHFMVRSALTPGCSIRLIPVNYNGASVNDEEGLNLGKFPICSWATDMYTNWLTQNSVNIATNIISGGIQTIGGAVMMGTGAGAGIGALSMASGLNSIASALGTVHQHSFQPPQARGNLNAGDVVTSSGDNTFHFYRMSIKKEYAKIIDDFFTMFGYQINRVKVPNKAHRSRWWYTKTLNVNIDGAIPNKDMQKIKDCYNNGITFWRNPSEIQNYSLSNGINATAGAVTDID